MGIDETFRRYVKTFAATDLKPYAEPVPSEELRQGQVYLALQFVDEDLLVPVLQPLLFLGWNLDGDEPRVRFFQDYESFVAGVRYASRSETDSVYFEAYSEGEGSHFRICARSRSPYDMCFETT